MKTSKTKLLLAFFISGFFLFGLAEITNAADYYVPATTSTVDGDTFCGGKCTSADTIYLQGPRGDLKIKNFDGDGEYITITNEPNHQVILTGTTDLSGTIVIVDCSYLDLRGDNSASHTYGIVCINPRELSEAFNIWVYHNAAGSATSDHIKLSYMELYSNGVGDATATGIAVIYGGNPNTYIYDTFEIHHNYIHHTGYAGMYLGQNLPWSGDKPYIKDFSVHDNLLEDMGAYGITMKGVRSDSGVCSIYNNVVKRTGLVYASDGSAWHGIGVQYFEGATYANIYNNWIEKTKGPGLKIGDQNHNVYDNIIVGCGTGDAVGWGHGIITYQSTYGSHIYDNIIIQPTRYGVYAWGTTQSVTLSRNLIGDAGVGEWYEMESGDAAESTGADANIYHANVADFNFNVWSDDGDYSNDDFTFGTTGTTHILTEAMGTGYISPASWTPNAVPGDTIIIAADRTSGILLEDFDGTPSAPYLFTNPSDAKVVLSGPGTTDWGEKGIHVFDSDNFKILGNNYLSETYGIEIHGITNAKAGLRMFRCADWEIGYMHVHDTYGGITQNYNDPWTQANSMGSCRLHHSYINNVASAAMGSEAVYLGKSSTGDYPHWTQLEIDHLRIENITCDGIQSGQTEKLLIHDNYVQDVGLLYASEPVHAFGIIASAEGGGG